MLKRIFYGLIIGSILGLVCILGASLRSKTNLDTWYLFAFWFNRFLMGFVFALLPINIPIKGKIIRGVLIGLGVSFAFYSATNYQDFLGFIVGAFYGLILEFLLHYIFIGKNDVSKT
ncbi:MAG: hypothetical protein AB7E09_06685 [Candidatus Izemoplasmatales bacterium]|uniref:MFS transporter n=1 Tax=Hujiaoplasma nucleasis TaxID=2725268 RepID=A0A7L6N5D9_9MOLU|nr:hypothetical protein [Hujiaoplasma nucleasis]QLY40781.1 hypothetical protein HF295_07910 [Hujiaoplasma nucleasis]